MIDKDDVLLPLATPPLTGFLRWVYTLAIACQSSQAEGWLCNNFINLYCTTSYRSGYAPPRQMVLDFWRGGHSEFMGNNPFLETEVKGYDDSHHGLNENTVIDICIDALQRSHYPILFLDEAVLPFSTEFGKGRSYPHRLLLHGYASARQSFFAYSFGRSETGNTIGQLGTHLVSFTDIQRSVASIRHEIVANQQRDLLSVFCRLLPTEDVDPVYALELSAEEIASAMRDYLAGVVPRPPNSLKQGEFVFGTKVFSELANYFVAVAEGSIGESHRRDVRHIHVLEEHHKLMFTRFMTLLDRGRISNPEGIHKQALRINEIALQLKFTKIRMMAWSSQMEASKFKTIAQKVQRLGHESHAAMELLAHSLTG